MSEKVSDKLIEKIQKLFALAGNNPNEQEAQLAAAKAHELLVEHGLSMSEVEGHENGNTEFVEEIVSIGTKKVPRWEGYLAVTVSERFYCKVIKMNKWKDGDWNYYYTFVGRPNDCRVASYTFEFLRSAAKKCADKYWKDIKVSGESWKYKHGKGEKAAYQLGFVVGVKETLMAQIKKEQEMGLIYVGPSGLNKYYEDKYNPSKGKKSGIKFKASQNSYNQGYEDGKETIVNNGVESGKGKTKMIGG